MNKKELIDKLLLDKKDCKKLFFSNEEIEFIKSQKLYVNYDEDNDAILTIQLFHLIVNCDTNIDLNFREYIKNILSIPHKYFTDTKISDYSIYGIKISDIIKFTPIIANKNLSVEQAKIYNLFSEFNVCLEASTGSGKTFLASNFIIEQYKKNKNDEANCDKKIIYIVPTEILETQIINRLHSSNNDIKENIGNSIDQHSVFVGTSEKLISAINFKEVTIEIDTLVVDEAHSIFDKNDNRCVFLSKLIENYLSKGCSLNKVILISPFRFDMNSVNCLFKNIDFLLLKYKKTALLISEILMSAKKWIKFIIMRMITKKLFKIVAIQL